MPELYALRRRWIWLSLSLVACTPPATPPIDTDSSSSGGVASGSSGGIASGSSGGVASSSSGLGGSGAIDTTASTDTEVSGTSTGEPADDCGAIDEPDPDGVDDNGDGIDGVAGCSVFVDTNVGDDGNDGRSTKTAVGTIARGLEIAASFSPPRPVLVAAGLYEESVVLESGVGVYGGYASGTWTRNIDGNPTIVRGTEPRTLVASGLRSPVEIQGLVLHGPSFAGGGQSTYAVWARDLPAGLLSLRHCTIEAGEAGAGDDGVDGAAGADGDDGSLGGGSACGANGGTEGSGLVCPSTGGSPGAAGGSPTPVGQAGTAGVSHCGSSCDDLGTDGLPGLPGSTGAVGMGAPPPTDALGQFDGDGSWSAVLGAPATAGDHGGGGGGGGAGGYDNDPAPFCLFDMNGPGGDGGHGGAGGCGGAPGGIGMSGGASFAVVAIDASITLANTQMVLGIGGDGGQGGSGGPGGLFGVGGPGMALPNATTGGAGGDGGAGGGGGGGAGGCGGPSIGIALVGMAEVDSTDVDLLGGLPGLPGLGGSGGATGGGGPAASVGGDGCPGVVMTEYAYRR
ncbi:MAG: hypothetical protein AAGF11_36115 [Myxococcota bacterium]